MIILIGEKRRVLRNLYSTVDTGALRAASSYHGGVWVGFLLRLKTKRNMGLGTSPTSK